MKLPFVSIVIIAYDAKEYLDDCFSSLEKIDYPKGRFEVILTDNNSTDATVEYTRKKYPWVKVLTLDKNYGYAEGNNRGIEVSKGEYIIFLNQDTKVEKEWLMELVKAAESDRKIGICGSFIKYFYKPKIIQSAENYLDFFGNLIHKGWGEEDRGQFKHESDVFCVSGTSLLIRRSILKKLRYCFDPSYFMYFEETDLCWRVRLLGYKVVFVPASVVYHKGNIKPQEVKPINIFRYTRNKIWSFRKNLRFPLKQLLLLLVLLRTSFAVLYWNHKGKWTFGLSFISDLFSPVTPDVDLSKISLKRQLNVFSLPNIKSILSFFKL